MNIMTSKSYTVQIKGPSEALFSAWFSALRRKITRISDKRWLAGEWKMADIRWTNHPNDVVILIFKSKRRANRVAKMFDTEAKLNQF